MTSKIMRDLLTLHLGRNGYDVVAAEDAVVADTLLFETRRTWSW